MGDIDLSEDSIEKMYQESGPKESKTHHEAIESKCGFSYPTLLGEIMYAYMSCWRDIGYTVTTLSKFSVTPTEYHYGLLKKVALFFRDTTH